MRRRVNKARGDSFETAMEHSLEPGYFIGWREMPRFISGLEDVEKRIAALRETDPDQAAKLYETFLACCQEKAEEVDDSGADFGMFVEGLVCGWVKARQAAGTDPRETVRALLVWADADDYGYGDGAQQAVIKAMDRKGLVAYAEEVRTRFHTARCKESSGLREERGEHIWLGRLLKMILAAQRDVAAYVALCEETELLSSDCKALAEIFRSRRKYEKALEWVDRGLKLAKNSRWMESGAYGLDDLRRTLLVTLGRSGEALSSAWAEFESHPNIFSYDELMKYVPRADRPGWHDRAMAASETASLDTVIELWLHTRETDRLVRRLRSTPVRKLEALSHYTMEPAAKKLAPAYPEVAAKVYQALGLRIVNAGKSKYYGAALSHFERARHCYEKAGLTSTWSRLVTGVRKKHSRKYGFMPGFERIAKGMKLREERTLLERARRRRGQWWR